MFLRPAAARDFRADDSAAARDFRADNSAAGYREVDVADPVTPSDTARLPKGRLACHLMVWSENLKLQDRHRPKADRKEEANYKYSGACVRLRSVAFWCVDPSFRYSDRFPCEKRPITNPGVFWVPAKDLGAVMIPITPGPRDSVATYQRTSPAIDRE